MFERKTKKNKEEKATKDTKASKNEVAVESNGKVLEGIVSSDKMTDTIVVDVLRYHKHPKYGKFINTRKKYKAHDAGNTAKIGDKVVIAETTPLSKDKKNQK
jgi:small subunit ribosomal protein S17